MARWKGRNKYIKALKKIESDLPKIIGIGLTKGAHLVRRTEIENIRKNFRQNSGSLARSVRVEKAKVIGNNVVVAKVIAGGGAKAIKYAWLQEKGGTIRPKNKQALTIPVGRMRSGRGRRRSARQMLQQSNVFLSGSKSSGFRGAKEKFGSGATGTIYRRMPGGREPLFVLKTQVTIPPQPYAVPALQKNRKRIKMLVLKEIDKNVLRRLE